MTGKQFKKLREELGITLSELAKKLNCTKQNISLTECRYYDRDMPGNTDNKFYKGLVNLIEIKLKKTKKTLDSSQLTSYNEIIVNDDYDETKRSN